MQVRSLVPMQPTLGAAAIFLALEEMAVAAVWAGNELETSNYKTQMSCMQYNIYYCVQVQVHAYVWGACMCGYIL